MPLFAGKVLLADRAEEGWLQAQGGAIVACGLGDPPEAPSARGWIVPMPVNAHTHAGDTALRDVPGKPESLGSLVGPGGWKHQHLAAADEATLGEGFVRLAEEAAGGGTARILDFREGGIAGLRMARRASHGPDWPGSLQASWFGRPAQYGFDEDEAVQLVDEADGIGLSAVRDFPRYRDVEAWAEAAHDAKLPFALHASEGVREDIDAILALEPSFLVHGCRMTRGDLEEVAASDVPIVVCPRSNRRFDLKAPVRAMLEQGVQLAWGTDNGMLQDADLWKEAALARVLWDLDEEAALRIACYGGWRAAGAPPPEFRRGPADWIVLPGLPDAPGTRPVLAPREAPREEPRVEP